MFKPIDRMWDRVEAARDDSDIALFYDLMKLGELVTKTAIAGMVAAVQDDRERHRYRLLHGLVRSNGLGDWSRAVQEAVNPPFSEHLTPATEEEQRELNQKHRADSWQYEAFSLLVECFEQLSLNKPSVSVTGLEWLHSFASLRIRLAGTALNLEKRLARVARALRSLSSCSQRTSGYSNARGRICTATNLANTA